jgi:hypothetical protein
MLTFAAQVCFSVQGIMVNNPNSGRSQSMAGPLHGAFPDLGSAMLLFLHSDGVEQESARNLNFPEAFLRKRVRSALTGDAGGVRRQLGFFAWLYVSLAVIESAIVVKHGRGMFPEAWPSHVLCFWGFTATIFTAVMIAWTLRRRQTKMKAS